MNNKGADQPAHLQSDQHFCHLLHGKYYCSTCDEENLHLAEQIFRKPQRQVLSR